MTSEADPQLAPWIMGLIEDRPIRPGSFLKSLAECACRADPENYKLLRPALLKLRAKYPQYHFAPEGDLMNGNHERDMGGHGK
jgi:hypothetical protein